jgi:outer membrane protein assembly factor BamB
VGSDEGSVHALDASSGNLLCSYAASAKVRATPAVSGELAVVGDFAGARGARVADGSAAWTTRAGASDVLLPCLAADLCVVGCNEGHVHGVDMKNGQPRFEALTRGPVVSSAAAWASVS